jgi:hypothetical protein
MDDEKDAGRGANGKAVIGFVALAIMLGPVASFVAVSFAPGVEWQALAGGAVAPAIAGGVLLMLSALRGERLPNAWQSLAVGVLLVPRVLNAVLGAGVLRLWLHETGWGVALLIAVAAPLWLGLLFALRMVSAEVPRAVIAASIAGVGAVLLVIPTDAYAIAANQIPMLLVRLLLGIATVFAWWFARERLVGAAVLSMAGLFLLLSAGVGAVSSVLVERAAWQPVEWREAAVPLLMQAGLAAASYWLWFYLLVRMRFTGFVMHPLAVWAATLVAELVVVRFAAWRIDLAATIAIGAIVVGVRARIADEQPTALGLRGM